MGNFFDTLKDISLSRKQNDIFLFYSIIAKEKKKKNQRYSINVFTHYLIEFLIPMCRYLSKV